MSRLPVFFLALVAVCVAQSHYTPSGWTVSNPVVVELFTSEGCSSCPPADRALANFDSAAIILGEHVDYWDGDGWKDRFSSPLFSARQQEYGIAMNNTSVFTPQAVINGERQVLGSDSRALSSAISAASSKQGTPVTLRMIGGNVSITVGKLPEGSHKADVLLAIAENNLSTNVGAGENAGRVLRHVAVVRTLSKLAELDPSHPGEYTAEARLNLKPEWIRSNLKVVLLVQDKQNRHILGAASVKM
jgi:hypothetical protein